MAVIEVENLVKRYDGRVVVDDISFAVEEGEIFAILGPNGRERQPQLSPSPGCVVRTVAVSAFPDSIRKPTVLPVSSRLMDQVRQPWKEAVGDRELEVLRQVAAGSTNREIAERLFITEATVKTHLLHIFTKLGVNDRAAAAAAGFESGLLKPGEK